MFLEHGQHEVLVERDGERVSASVEQEQVALGMEQFQVSVLVLALVEGLELLQPLEHLPRDSRVLPVGSEGPLACREHL